MCIRSSVVWRSRRFAWRWITGIQKTKDMSLFPGCPSYIEEFRQLCLTFCLQPGAPFVIRWTRLRPGKGIAHSLFQWTKSQSCCDSLGYIHAREACTFFVVGDPCRHVAPGFDLVLIEKFQARPSEVRVAAAHLFAHF